MVEIQDLHPTSCCI